MKHPKSCKVCYPVTINWWRVLGLSAILVLSIANEIMASMWVGQ